IRQLFHRIDYESVRLREAKSVGVVLGERGGQILQDIAHVPWRRRHGPVEPKHDVRVVERNVLNLAIFRLQEIGSVAECADRIDRQKLVLAIDIQKLGSVAIRLRGVESSLQQTPLRRYEVNLDEVGMDFLDLEGAVAIWVMQPEAEHHQLASS